MSLVVHGLVFLALAVSSGFSVGNEPRPVVYRVDLIELPEPQEPAPARETPEPTPVPETAPPEPVPEPAPKVPAFVPEPEAKRSQTRDVELTKPKAAEPKALNVDEPERERRPEPEPEPPAPETPAEPAPAAERPRPRGASATMSSDSAVFTEYAYYRVAMRNKIAAAWSPPRAASELVTVIRFRIVRSGAVIGARVEQSSGLAFFDHTALRAVNEASPLPALPADFPDDVVTVTFEFAYKP